MEKLQHLEGVTVTWRAFELRPQGSPPMPPEFRARIEASRPRLIAMARDQYGLAMNSGPFGINSRPALIAAAFASQQGVGPEFHRLVMRAYWQEAQDISQVAVLTQIGQQVGLAASALTAALEAAEYDQQVQADVDQAAAIGLTGVPAMVFDQRYLVVGAQPYATLVDVVRRCQPAHDQSTNG